MKRGIIGALVLALLLVGGLAVAEPNPSYSHERVAQVASMSYLPALAVHSMSVEGLAGGSFSGGPITSNIEMADTIDILLASSSEFCWSSTTDPTGSGDVGIKRSAAGILQITDCSTGTGSLQVGGSTASDNSTQAFSVATTLPTTPSAAVYGGYFNVTGAGSAAQAQFALATYLQSGYTGASGNAATYARNESVGTGNNLNAGNGSIGIYGITTGAGTGDRVGVFGYTAGATSGESVGVFGWANSGTTRWGVAGAANSGGTGDAGGAFWLGTAEPSLTGATALLADNVAESADIFIARDNGAEVFAVGDDGDYRVYRTVTAGGTTGNQTINKPAGTVNYAAAASAITVTNSLVDASSIIFGTIRTADATCTAITSIVPGAGSFVITLNAGCTAETSVGFLVTN